MLMSEHADLTPAQREEVQDFWLMVDTKRRDFRASGQPERRGLKRWPRNVWPANDYERRLERLLAARTE